MPSDDDLLARLNALKQSSVATLDTNYSASIAPSSRPKPTDDLAARFLRLGSASPLSSPQPSITTSSNNVGHAPAAAPGASGYLEGIADGIGGNKVEFNEEDEKSLEELLGELNGAVGERKDWDISIREQEDVGKLLRDMKRILPEVVNSRSQGQEAKGKEGITDWESIEINVADGRIDTNQEEDRDESGEDKKRTEDEEADDLIARVMAELDISRKYDPPSPSPADDDHDHGNEVRPAQNDASLSLPSAPTDIPEDDLQRTQAIEDAFTARLAALSAPAASQTDSLGLPSAPSFSLRKKPPVNSSLQQRIDEEAETWCIICNDDATLKCLGCDNDLYCQNCWMEGHRGESAGFEERTHKAVLYAKKKKQAA